MNIPKKKKARTGFLRSSKYPKKAHRHYGIQRYCVICKKAGMSERKYTSHIAKDCIFVHTNRSIKYRMGEPVGSRAYALKQYKKSENKRKKELKALKK